jgi:hypothetical protein
LERILLREIKDGITLSPYLDINNEYRVVVLNGEGLCIYKKNRIYVKGDGKSSLSQLITSQVKDNDLRNNIMTDLAEDKEMNPNQIIGNNESHLAS